MTYRYSISVDGNGLVETNKPELIERTVDVALRNGRHHEVSIEDRETGETIVYRVERRVSVERRSGRELRVVA